MSQNDFIELDKTYGLGKPRDLQRDKKLDPEVLDYYVIDKEWTVRIIMVHIVTASYLYSQRLQEKPFSKLNSIWRVQI